MVRQILQAFLCLTIIMLSLNSSYKSLVNTNATTYTPPSSSGNSSQSKPSPSFFTLAEIPGNLPEIPSGLNKLAYAISDCFDHLHSSCEVCYFLGWHHPILIIETHLRGGWWDSNNYYTEDTQHCPWCFLDLPLSYDSFSSGVQAFLHHSNSGGGSHIPSSSTLHGPYSPQQASALHPQSRHTNLCPLPQGDKSSTRNSMPLPLRLPQLCKGMTYSTHCPRKESKQLVIPAHATSSNRPTAQIH